MKKVKLKPGTITLPVKDKIFFFNNVDKVAFTRNSQIEKLLPLLVKGIYLNEVDGDLRKVVEHLLSKELLIDASISEISINPYFERLLTFLGKNEPKIDRYKAFEKIENSKICIVGLGGLGTWMTQAMIMIGIKSLVLVDADRIEPSNFNRQLFWSDRDVGKPKVEVAKKEILSKRGYMNLTTFEKFINSTNDMDDVIKKTKPDIIITCGDNPLWYLRRWINDSAIKNGVPHLVVSGSRVGPFVIPYQTACIECLWKNIIEKQHDYEKKLQELLSIPQQKNGSMVSEPMVTVSFATKEIFNFITGISTPYTINHEFFIDINPMKQSRLVKINRQSNCSCTPLEGGEKNV